jgi:hypothetical protein
MRYSVKLWVCVMCRVFWHIERTGVTDTTVTLSFVYHDDGGSRFFCKTGIYLKIYTALHRIKPYSEQ